jgi:ribosomal protein L11
MEKPRAPIGDGLADQFVSLMDVTKQAATMSERLRIVKLVEVELKYWKRKTDQREVWEVLTNLIYKLTKAE